jgi:hypothetical protein
LACLKVDEVERRYIKAEEVEAIAEHSHFLTGLRAKTPEKDYDDLRLPNGGGRKS